MDDPTFDLDPEAARRKREATAAGRLAQTISNATSTQSQTSRPTVGTATTGGGFWEGGTGGVSTPRTAPTTPWNPNPFAGQAPAQAGGARPNVVTPDQPLVNAALGRVVTNPGQTPPWAGQTQAPVDPQSRVPQGQTPPWGLPGEPSPASKPAPGETPPWGGAPTATPLPGMVPVEADPARPDYATPGERGGATPTTSSFTGAAGGYTTYDPATGKANPATASAGGVPPPTPPTAYDQMQTRIPTKDAPAYPGENANGTPEGPAGQGGTTAPPTPPPTPPKPEDYGGYAKPAYTRPGSASVPAGWDAVKWADASHQTPKYVVGRILSNYPPTTAGFQSAMADIVKAYPGAKAVGNDKVDIPGVGVIDVLQSAGTGGVAWQWIDEANAGTPTVPPPAGGGDGPKPPVPGGGTGGGGAPGGGGGDGPKPPAPPTTPPAPAYQTYTYNTPTPNAPAPPPLLAPGTIGQYAGANTQAQTDAMANTAANGTAFTGGAAQPATSAAMKALMRAMGMAIPDAAGAKESAKETLNAARVQQEQALRQQAQAQGQGRSGGVLGGLAEIGDGFSGGLTRAYREIDADTQQRGFANTTAAAGALSGLGALQGAESRADYGTAQAGEQQTFNQNAALTKLLQDIAQGNYASQIAGGDYGLRADAAKQGQAQTAFQNALASAGFDFQKQQAQAGENYQYASLGQQNTQFNKQLEQQAVQAAAQMGYNWAELSQRDKQFFLDIKLRAALGASQQNQAYIDAIMRAGGA